jgi:hypothetical protein
VVDRSVLLRPLRDIAEPLRIAGDRLLNRSVSTEMRSPIITAMRAPKDWLFGEKRRFDQVCDAGSKGALDPARARNPYLARSAA